MNHPEFSNIENSGFFMTKMNIYNGLRTPDEGRDRSFLAALERRAGGFSSGRARFLKKFFQSFFKKHARPNRFFSGDF
jgi:hypothetical protein